MNVSTRSFERAHGRKPRGFGHWAFFPNSRQKMEEVFWVNAANYGSAVRQAKVEAKVRSWTEVHVGS